ncbi:MAG TPA: DUF420 domain-containing protein [bacterium]|nr:DUF420 domain-containing protein [bacterium]HMW32515.1 DUF420 domain-containing protein [bacterium]HMW35764.1 DUF420 domain-containing protein [bacterium]HMY35390.1 DUF420 domain-containing protein [bacterium]HMZ05375.1 DUF420 domain-containing protein [bacterium]
MNAADLPFINAILNSVSTVFLTLGYIAIRKKDRVQHKRYMVTALISSALFLTCYLIYHYQVGSVPYPYYDWTRPVYFVILVPHIILAAIMSPFIISAVHYAWIGEFAKHKRLMRWVWPVWMFVSVSGVVIYLMLYRF